MQAYQFSFGGTIRLMIIVRADPAFVCAPAYLAANIRRTRMCPEQFQAGTNGVDFCWNAWQPYPPIHVAGIEERVTAGPSRIFGVSNTRIEGWRKENSADQSLNFAAAAGLPLPLRHHSSSGCAELDTNL